MRTYDFSPFGARALASPRLCDLAEMAQRPLDNYPLSIERLADDRYQSATVQCGLALR